MLTLKQIIRVRRMIEQTGGYPAGVFDVYARSHDSFSYCLPVDSESSVDKKRVNISLDYALDKSGDVRIVKREKRE